MNQAVHGLIKLKVPFFATKVHVASVRGRATSPASNQSSGNRLHAFSEVEVGELKNCVSLLINIKDHMKNISDFCLQESF